MRPVPNLIVLTGLRRGTVLSLTERAVIGREGAVDLRLPDFLVSARHAEIVPSGDGFVVNDLASTNGTYKNGVRVSVEESLSLGDVLVFGTTEILFTDQERLAEDEAKDPSSIEEVLVEAEEQDPFAIRVISEGEEDLLVEAGESSPTLPLPVVDAVQRSFSLAWSLEDLLQRIADRFVRATGAAGAVIALNRDETGSEVVYRGTSSGETVFHSDEPVFAVREDLLERALGERGALLARGGPDNTSTSVIRSPEPSGEAAPGGGLALSLSLPTAAGIAGAIYLHDVRASLSREDLRVLFLMASLAGVHLRSHILVTELRDRNKKLKEANFALEEARSQLAEVVEERTAELGLAKGRMRLFSRIVEHVPEAVVSTTLDGVVTSWNPGAEQLYGYSAEEVLGEVLPTVPDDHSAEYERILQAVADGRSLAMRSERAAQDDRLVPVLATFAPVASAEGGIVGLVEIARDLTEQLRTEDRMRWQERMASFGELATGLAHELGNPLSNLRSGVEFLLAKPRPEEKQRSSLEVLHTEILRLQRLIGQALDLARWKTPVLGEVDCDELLDYVAAAVGQRASELSVEVVRMPQEQRTVVLADADQLKQALLNLTANALDAMKDGGRLELFTLRDDSDAPSAGFQIRDTGAGIDPDDRERMFDLFFSRSKNGSGIGLAIVKRIVDMHAGRITVDSESDAGTTISVLLARASGDPSAQVGQ